MSLRRETKEAINYLLDDIHRAKRRGTFHARQTEFALRAEILRMFVQFDAQDATRQKRCKARATRNEEL